MGNTSKMSIWRQESLVGKDVANKIIFSILVLARSLESARRTYHEYTERHKFPLEFIALINIQNKYSIPEAYSNLTNHAKGSYIIYTHDDVSNLQPNWDLELDKVFKKSSKIGAIGVAGGIGETNAPGSWWMFRDADRKIYSLVDIWDGATQQYPRHNTPIRVQSIDGVFIATRAAIAQNFSWDPLVGCWHGYDLDFSRHINYIESKEIVTMPGVFLHHHSKGTTKQEWALAMIRVWDKYYEFLEANAGKIDLKALKEFIFWTHTYHEIGRDLEQTIKKRTRLHLLSKVASLSYSRNTLCQKIGLFFINIASLHAPN